MKRGLILLNLGTPDAPEPEAVGRYLREFLMDPYVIDIPGPLRALLVKGLIVPRRKHTSAEAYQLVWTERGSPLLFHLEDLTTKVAQLLNGEFTVVPAMRYGKPSLQSALETLKRAQVDEILVFPLYPQYSLAATESSFAETRRLARELGLTQPPRMLGAFFGEAEFLDAYVQVIRRSLSEREWDHLLFSFHGLPEKQVKKTDRSPGRAHCLKDRSCCDQPQDANRDCYRHQCYETARLLAGRLGLSKDQYSVAFQSRLTRAWIRPFSDELYETLPRRSPHPVRKLAVACPAFVADCLETLEEVAMRGRESFREAGGEELFLIPSLNSESVWAEGLASFARRSVRQDDSRLATIS